MIMILKQVCHMKVRFPRFYAQKLSLCSKIIIISVVYDLSNLIVEHMSVCKVT